MSKKYNKVSMVLNYIQQLLTLFSTITGCVSGCIFSSLVGIPIGVSSFSEGLKICAITTRIKM